MENQQKLGAFSLGERLRVRLVKLNQTSKNRKLSPAEEKSMAAGIKMIRWRADHRIAVEVEQIRNPGKKKKPLPKLAGTLLGAQLDTMRLADRICKIFKVPREMVADKIEAMVNEKESLEAEKQELLIKLEQV